MSERCPRASWLLALVAALALLAALPAAAFAVSAPHAPVDRIAIADVPGTGGEDCVDDPDLHPGTGLRECPKGFDVASLLPFVAGGLGIVLAVLVGWYLFMRRRASRPFLPDEAAAVPGGGLGGGGTGAGTGDWWTCRTCGKTNLVGSARCYSCGSLQR